MNQIIPNTQQEILHTFWQAGILFAIAVVLAFIISRIRKARGRAHGDFLFITSVLLLILSLGIFAYHSNLFGIKDYFAKFQVQQQSRTIKKRAAKPVDRKLVAKMVMRDQNKNDKYEKKGFVAIPSVSILLPIYDDAYSVAGLNLGADFANRSAEDPKGEQTPMMGRGNYGLAAHNFNDGRTGFSALQEKLNVNASYLVNGQTGTNRWLKNKPVYLANGDGIYEYRITKQTTTLPTNVAVLNQTDQPQLTIVSCLFPNTNYRIITHAKLVKQYTWQKALKNWLVTLI
ncbi:sortase domain-bontaining protein [Weissella diestrammenae]|uniref:sortase family protein n=1 Tax=Weissella diestrammenae TaxID=1162633 RepID=UPI001FABF86B|nr:sortase [Weissella diestrammenae]